MTPPDNAEFRPLAHCLVRQKADRRTGMDESPQELGSGKRIQQEAVRLEIPRHPITISLVRFAEVLCQGLLFTGYGDAIEDDEGGSRT